MATKSEESDKQTFGLDFPKKFERLIQKNL